MENRTVGALVTVVSAAGRSALAYDITAGDEERCFLMNPYTGAVTLRRPLDYEVRRRKKTKKETKMQSKSQFALSDPGRSGRHLGVCVCLLRVSTALCALPYVVYLLMTSARRPTPWWCGR